MKPLDFREVLNDLLTDLDTNQEKLDVLKNQLVKSQQFPRAANIRDVEEGIEIMRKHILKYVDKAE